MNCLTLETQGSVKKRYTTSLFPASIPSQDDAHSGDPKDREGTQRYPCCTATSWPKCACPHLLLTYPPCRSDWGRFAVSLICWTSRNIETSPATTTPTPVCPAGLIPQHLMGTRARPCRQHSTGCSQGLGQTWHGLKFLQLGERKKRKERLVPPGGWPAIEQSLQFWDHTVFLGLSSTTLKHYAQFDTHELQTTVSILWGDVWDKASGAQGQAGRASLDCNSPAKGDFKGTRIALRFLKNR